MRFEYLRSWVLLSALMLCVSVFSACAVHRDRHPHSELHGKTLQALQRELAAGTTSSEVLVRQYLDRIEAIDRRGPTIRSVLIVNPEALEQARLLDTERREGRVRGALHGIPILLKDNIESADPMPTTAGSLALTNNTTGRDAPIVANLREAGAVILGKTNLSEWANFRANESISGWSAIGGLTKNPHVLDRTPCGSSAGSGAAVAAGLAAAAIGTETDGSIVCPASMNGVVGLKPTLGLLSGQRIVPISHSQDTAGPMGISVYDVAVVLDAMIGKAPACEAPATDCKRGDYLAELSTDALRGKRIGVMRFKPSQLPQINATYEQALQIMRDAGAELIEVETPQMEPINAAEEAVLFSEFKPDLNAYLATLPASIQTRTLESLIAFNNSSPRELALFGQEIFIRSNEMQADEKYRDALATSKRLAGEEGIARLLKDQNLDFLVAPTTGTAWRIDIANGDQFPGSFSTLSAVSGYPHLTLPMGKLHELPLGISFIGGPWTEAALLAAGYAFEQRAKVDIKAKFLESIDESNGAFEAYAKNAGLLAAKRRKKRIRE
jgi:amidase